MADRKWGMTRPWVMAPTVVIVVVTVFAAMAAGALFTWIAWSLGGVLVGALALTFDMVRKNGH